MNKGKVLWLDEGRRVKAMQIFLKLKNGSRVRRTGWKQISFARSILFPSLWITQEDGKCCIAS